ncbi:MAG: molybdenum cofactor guanylyltransferase [Candidatus Binataceae bacterium]
MRTEKKTASNSAIILAGGRSSRMGRPKAILPFNGATIIECIVAELRPVFSEIIVLTTPAADDQFKIDLKDVTIIHDELAFAGPVRALSQGLLTIRKEYAFVCSCDVPLIRAEVALGLCAMLGEYDAVIPIIGGRLQMMHAVYHRRCAAVLGAMEQRGERRLTELTGQIASRIVSEDGLKRFDATLKSFFNVNTPEDYLHALKLAGSRKSKD